jgi:hypothetical protein
MFKKIKQWISNVQYNWSYIKVLNSPFVGLKLKWYFGKIKHGTPYFLPRKWVKMTKIDCEKLLENDIKKCLPKYVEGRTWEYYKNYKKPIPIKYFGWNSCTLGWKTKWDNYRFEWAPCYSLVVFGKQLFVCVLPKIDKQVSDSQIRQNCYWETWLTYNYRTDKSKSKKERLQEVIKQYSCTWGNQEKGYIDYYPLILKKKYIK